MSESKFDDFYKHWIIKLQQYESLGQVDEKDFSLIYHNFIDGIKIFDFESTHYYDDSIMEAKDLYSYKYHSHISIIIKIKISNHIESIVPKEEFYTFLRDYRFNWYPSDIFQLLFKKLAHTVQKNIDNLKNMWLNFFCKNESFYNEYPPFNNLESENIFIVENIIKEIYFEPHNSDFFFKDNFKKITINYLKNSIVNIRENHDKFDSKSIRLEINRLESIKIKNKFLFVDEYIKLLKDVISDLNFINTDKNIIPENTKKLSSKQKEVLYNFLQSYFRVSTQEDIKNLIDLKLNSIKGNLKLIKHTKSFSLLLYFLLEKGYYSKSQIYSIFDFDKIIPTKGIYFDRKVLSKYFSKFEEGKTIDNDKEIKNINSLLKSF